MKKILILVATMLFASLAFGDEGKVYKLKLASSWDSTMPILGEVPKRFKEVLERMSNGRIELRIDYPSKHKSPFAMLDFTKTGQYDIGYTASYYYKGKDAKTMFFTAVPFMLNTDEQQAWYKFGGGKELEAKVFDSHNIKVFNAGNTGMQMGGWFKKEIKNVDDLKGLKIRIPGFGGEIYAKLGANINTIPTGELYMALEMGTIDAVEWVSPAYDMALGFHKVAKFYYTGWQEPNGETQFFVNKKAYEKLPTDLQAIFEAAAAQISQDVRRKAFFENTEYWAKMKSEFADIEVKSFTPDVIAALKKATNELLDEQSKKDPLFKEIVESQRAFLKKAREWSKISDFAYIQNTSE
ncbi:TRAP transporter substrate-binding protein DctP [Campylobacter sp. faydin G-24]|uniref:TRAP transporter substrate-binding protein DctP n=1 Tax=Campylobacter anatolicus TaxID=2829105 RepID=A0ABS5HHX9_9BACT|nr:TRAP transporter substrate-binding protein DctP [Campylobacter anatolicus]MBR8463117.1 TRAP transporter substrate-binding protein DctP [Campylobacter anatolicus]MBR8465562.1 TRAP transporter substrate-binding protein DctP [Campylobacter anatolicus]